jgi:hypothetical protein
MVTMPVTLPPAASEPDGCCTEQAGGWAAELTMLQARFTVPEPVVELTVTVAVPELPRLMELGLIAPTETVMPGLSGLYFTTNASRQGLEFPQELL